jgi:hypothetical protein
MVRLRLETVKLIDAGGKPYERDLWVAAERVPAWAEAVDPPEKLLVRFALGDALEPGAYAVSWGAFEGYTVTEAHAYAFRVIEPEPEEDGEPASDQEETPSAPTD